MEHKSQDYTITLIHKPGYDFYDTYAEIITPSGRKQIVMVDGDDYRWWGGLIEHTNNLIWFRRSRGIFVPDVGKELWFDPASLMVGRTGDTGVWIEKDSQ